MHDCSNLIMMAAQPTQQIIWTNDVMHWRRSDIAPLFARPEKIADNDTFSGRRQLEDNIRPYEPSAARHNDQIVARTIVNWRHDPFSRTEFRTEPMLSYGETEPFTTIPVITGPVIVFNNVKNFCSSLSLALAT